MPYKVIVWGTGSIGSVALREVLRTPNELKLVGVKVFSDEKVGKDAAELCGETASTGVKAVKEIDDLPLDDADCVIYCPMLPDHDHIAHLLRKGVNVVTTAFHLYPKFLGDEIFNKLDEAGKAGGASFHGSGINPAFMSDILPITLSGLSVRAKKITVREVSPVNHYTATAPEFMCDRMGFGKKPEDAQLASRDGIGSMKSYWGESMTAIADHIGVKIDRIEELREVAVATEPVVLESGRVIEAGTIGCQAFWWHGYVDGEPRICLGTFWKVTDKLDPPMDVTGSELVNWTATIEGTPSIKCVVEIANSFDPNSSEFRNDTEAAAVLGTATHAINAIPFVVKAAPGIQTFLDMPIITSIGGLK